MNQNTQPQGDTRKPYNKPKIELVKLVAEEAVLSACKTDISGGPSAGTFNCTTDLGGDCLTPGS